MRLAFVILVALAGVAHAHDLRPGILAFVEDAPGELRMRFVPPIDNTGEAVELALVLPPGCTRSGDRVACKRGFAGELAVGGMRGHAMKIYVSLQREGTRRDWVLTSTSPRIIIDSPSRSWLADLDDLAVVLGLVLGFAWSRRGAWTIGAFALAHLLASLVDPIASAPLHACSALAALLLARDALRAERRVSPVTAAVFGIVLGLDGAHPWQHELGLVAMIAIAVGFAAIVRRLVRQRRVIGLRAHHAACYALGALSAYWLIERACS